MEAIIDYVIDSFKSLQLCLVCISSTPLAFNVTDHLIVSIYRPRLPCCSHPVFTARTYSLGGTREPSKILQTTQYLGTILNGLANGIQESMNSTVSAANSAIDSINSVINRFNSVADVPGTLTSAIFNPPIPPIPCLNPFGCRRAATIPTIPHVSIPFDVSVIRNFTIPDTFTNQLTALNNSVPTLDQLRSDLETIVSTPFNLIKQQMNTTFSSIGTPNVTVPLPPVQDIQFCGGLDTGFIDEIGNDLVTIAHIGIGVLAAIAVIIFVVNGFLVWIRWKFMNRHVDAVRERWAAGQVSESTQPVLSEKEAAAAKTGAGTTSLTPEALLTLNNELSHSFAYKILDIIERIPFIHLSPVAHDRLAWFLSYIFAPPALVCFLVGLFGILAICIQLIAIKPIQQKVDQEVEKVVQLVITSVGGKINAAVASDSQTFATAVNGQLSDIDTTVNGQLFGWISNATSVLNNTVVAYYNDLENGINTAFGSTLLASPMTELLHCILGSKIDALEGAVSYLQAHLHIPVPRVSPDILLLSNSTLNEVANPIADAAIGGGNGGVFGLLVNRYLDVLQRYVSSSSTHRYVLCT